MASRPFPMQTPTARQALIRLLALVLAFALPLSGMAAPAQPATVAEALEAGDLTGAREMAVADRTASPGDPEAWRAEAEVHEAAGDFAAAIEARQGQLAALPADSQDRAPIEQRILQLREQSRGTVADEPPSSHREELDARRSPPKPAVKPAPAPAPAEPPKDRIVKKWYFWVTMAAIVASAAAITGIAIKAATSERSDDLDALVPGGGNNRSGGASLFRF